MTCILGTLSPPLVIASSVLFMVLEPLRNVEPSRKFKIGVRAGLIVAVWFAGGAEIWSNWKVEEAPVDSMAAWIREGFSYKLDACQCPVLSSNLSVPPWQGLPIEETVNPTTRALDNVYAIVTSPETIFALVLAAFLKASHEVLALENDL